MTQYRDAGGNQPIILYLRQWVPVYFPLLTSRRRRGQHPSGVGGYNNAPGGGAHIEGRAADIYVNARREDEKPIGDGLFEMFSKHPGELGVETVTWHVRIWNSEQNDPPGTSRPYTRGDHDDHVHVAFTREGSQQQPPILLVYFEEFASPTG
jgi:hypothetical protein